jgi:predicted  nucleic acid-binding Zn-ribbon protein
MASWKERVDRHEREIAAIRKLIHKGMKMFVKAEEEHAAFRKELRELAAQQRATARELARISHEPSSKKPPTLA